MLNQKLPIIIKGHLTIKDDLGTILVDKDNAIHPMNMSRAIARALAKESNYFIHRMAFGNGGTQTGINTITYNDPNVGGSPAQVSRWTDKLYNETYTEIINEDDVNVDTGAGSADQNPLTAQNSVVSTEPNVLSQVTITVELNQNEPVSQYLTDILPPTEASNSEFTFDEIGLFTTGLPLVATAGYQTVDVGTKVEASDTGLLPSTIYNFQIAINGSPAQLVTFTTPVSGSGTAGEILYSDLVTLVNAVPAMSGASVSIGQTTFGKLKFTSGTTGASSSIALTNGGGPNTALFTALTGYTTVDAAVVGQAVGVQNDSVTPANEAERMLTHVIFSPVLKSANRSLTISYVLTIAVSGS